MTKHHCKFRVVGGVALAIAWAVGPTVHAYAQQAALVAVDAVIEEPLRQTQPIEGRFVARRSGPIAAQSRGAVMEMLVSVGDRVEKGAVLAELDTDRLEAEAQRQRANVGYRQAQVAGAKARYQQAEQELSRMQKLRKSSAFSLAKLDDLTSAALVARLEITEASAVLETAKADLALATLNLDRARITAPFAGVVARRYIQPGAFVSDGTPVVDLIDDRSLEIEADVPSSRIPGLVAGLPVTVELNGLEPRKAIVRAVIPQENAMSRTRAVRFTPQFDPSIDNAATGAAATVRVPVGAARNVLTVHKDAVIEQGGYYVYVVEEGKAIRKRVLVGESSGGRFVVLEGLEAGMLAVVRGNERLRPGQPVTTGGKPGAAKPAASDKAADDSKGKGS